MAYRKSHRHSRQWLTPATVVDHAFWDGESKGTRHMINIMLDLGKPVEVHIVKTA